MLSRIGPYEVLEEIARGGMGVVYRARDPRLSREVALKVLVHVEKEAHAQRLIREAESLARLRHPHIVRVHGVELEQGRPVLVMEWVAGESLQDRLDRDGPLEPDDAIELTRSLAHALAYAHTHGVLHRDLKPANVLLDETGAPRLVDFGIAQLLDDQGPRLSQTGALVGSPGYFAPEQAFGKRDAIGPWTDVYGLGGTLYAALTGGPPFEGESLAELALAAARADPDPPSTRAPGIGPALDALCLRCLAKEPTERFESADELLDALADDLTRGAPARGAVIVFVGLLALVPGLLMLGLATRPSPDPPPPPEVKPVASSTPTPAPPKPEQWLKRARARYARGEYADALEAVERTLQRDPDDLAALELRGMTRIRLRALPEAQRDIARLLELAPESPHGHYVRGQLLVATGELRAAVEALEAALARDPNHLPSIGQRAQCRIALGQHTLALADLKHIVAARPKRADYRRELATLLMNRSAFEEARAHAEQALELEQSAKSYYTRGTVRGAQGDREGAFSDLSEAIRLDPKLSGPYRTRGLLRNMDGDSSGGLADLDIAVELSPHDLLIRAERIQILQALGRFDQAERDITEIRRAKPRDQAGLMLWVRQAILQKQYGEALRRVEIALAEYPTWAKLYGKRAACRLYLRQYEACIADCNKALASKGEFYPATRMRATAQARLGRYAEAVIDLRRLLAKLPSHRRRDRANIERQLAEYERRARR